MKIRNGFVSNSSTTAFLCVGTDLSTEEPAEVIKLLKLCSFDINEETFDINNMNDFDSNDETLIKFPKSLQKLFKKNLYEFLYHNGGKLYAGFTFTISSDDSAGVSFNVEDIVTYVKLLEDFYKQNNINIEVKIMAGPYCDCSW